MELDAIAKVKYPNLVAERRYCQCNIPAWADHANVTIDVMEDVLNGTDDLTYEEALGLTRLLMQYGPAIDEFSFMAYLFANKMTNVKLTEELFNQLWDLKLVCETTIQYSKKPVDFWYTNRLNHICYWFDELRDNQVVPYALVRNYLGQANDILSLEKTKEKRSGRLCDITNIELEAIEGGA